MLVPLKMPTLYKTTQLDGSGVHGGTGKWDLPKDDAPGEWRSVPVASLTQLASGLALTPAWALPRWLGPVICEAEYEGEANFRMDKVVVRKARLVKRLNWNGIKAIEFGRACCHNVGLTVPPIDSDYHIWASNCAMAALKLAADRYAEHEWQVRRLFKHINGEA